MNFFNFIVLLFTCSVLTATEFTVGSYNCGGLSDHYDYLRAACMQKLMQERHTSEPEEMALNEKIQQVALLLLFAPNAEMQEEWDQKGYQRHFENLTSAQINAHWHQKANEIITSYTVRPVFIDDVEVTQMLNEHLAESSFSLAEARDKMAKRIFTYHLKFDLLCLQEANYLRSYMFPDHYETHFSDTTHSQNGVAWNKNRFELIKSIGNILGKAFAVQLRDKETGKSILLVSGHISGCNPYRIEKNDSAKGDAELKTIIDLFEKYDSDFMVIGMDANVTSLHPRLRLIKEAGYQIDCENFIESTCTNPYQVLNTRIDWIALKSKNKIMTKITNIPVLSVDLNNIQTNMSDHKPVAAKIEYGSRFEYNI